MTTTAFEVCVRRIATGSDFTIRLFAVDATVACDRAKVRAKYAFGIRRNIAELEASTGCAVFRIVSCRISQDQSRPVSREASEESIAAIDALVAAAMAEPEIPGLCYVAVPGAKIGARIAVIFRGEKGYHVADFDHAGIPASEIAGLVEDLNAGIGVDKIEARAMLCGSMFGWNVPAATSRHVRDAIAEAAAVAAAQ